MCVVLSKMKNFAILRHFVRQVPKNEDNVKSLIARSLFMIKEQSSFFVHLHYSILIFDQQRLQNALFKVAITKIFIPSFEKLTVSVTVFLNAARSDYQSSLVYVSKKCLRNLGYLVCIN